MLQLLLLLLLLLFLLFLLMVLLVGVLPSWVLVLLLLLLLLLVLQQVMISCAAFADAFSHCRFVLLLLLLLLLLVCGVHADYASGAPVYGQQRCVSSLTPGAPRTALCRGPTGGPLQGAPRSSLYLSLLASALGALLNCWG